MDTIKKQRNIILIYIHTFLSTFILYYICDTLFYIERGLTSSQYISFVGIAFILLIYIFSESFENIMISELHNNISSKSRVTVESINQFVLNLFGVIFSFFMTILLKFISISFMYIIIGVIIILFGIFNLIALKIRK